MIRALWALVLVPAAAAAGLALWAVVLWRRRGSQVAQPVAWLAVVLAAAAGVLTPAAVQVTAECRPGANAGFDYDRNRHDPTRDVPTARGPLGLPMPSPSPANQTHC